MVTRPSATPIRDFWPHYRRHTIFSVALLQFAILFGLYAVVTATNELAMHSAVAWMLIVSAFVIGVLISVVGVVFILLRPLRDLSAAITHISSEPNQVKPPSINDDHHQRSGLKHMIELLYNLAANEGSTTAAPSDAAGLIDTALRHSSASVVVMDGGGTISYASAQAPVRTTNDGSLELELIFDEEVDFTAWRNDSVSRLMRSQTTWQRVANKVVGEEDRRIFDIVASYEKGNPAEVVLVLLDRSELYQPEDDQLDFIAFAAHELRGPITVIRGYLDVLTGELESPTSDKEEQRELLSRLTVSANRLSGYINNILNTSRHDRRHMKLSLSEHRLSDIYDLIRDDMDLRASTQNRLLSITLPDNLPTIAADTASLSEVFSNLIDNAIKYSSEGGAITVTAQADGDPSFIRVDVTDTGIGMPANVVRNLFHKFYRSHRSRETVAGTGIGLYICKAIIEAHGGHIEVRSEEGRGSTFSFTVPTFTSVAANLAEHDNTNVGLIRMGNDGWIKNHAKYRG